MNISAFSESQTRLTGKTAAMPIFDIHKLNRAAAFLYAFGVWTMIGSFAMLRYSGRFDFIPDKKDMVQQPEDPDTVISEDAHTITSEKDSFPLHDDNFISPSTAETGTEGNDK